jgi:hypothetical protein
MPKKETLSLQVNFTGVNLGQQLITYYDVAKTIWDNCLDTAPFVATVNVLDRGDPDDPLEWHLSLATPAGRQSFTVIQPTPNGAIEFRPL